MLNALEILPRAPSDTGSRCLATSALPTPPPPGTTIPPNARLVGPGHPYATIQAAIDAAAVGDTILVAPGTYREMITIAKAKLTIRALDPKAPPVLDGADPGFVPTWTKVSGSVWRTSYGWGGLRRRVRSGVEAPRLVAPTLGAGAAPSL